MFSGRMLFHEFVQDAKERFPERLALKVCLMPNEKLEVGPSELTYQEFWNLTGKIAEQVMIWCIQN